MTHTTQKIMDPRSERMLELLAEGASARVIAKKLGYSEGTMRAVAQAIVSVSAPSSQNGADQWKYAPIITPAGTPAMAAIEKPVMMMPVAAPRRSTGTMSATMAMTPAPSTPPVMPANARLTSSSG